MSFWNQCDLNKVIKNSCTAGAKSNGGDVLLCLDFLTVLEGEANFISTVNGGVFDKIFSTVNAELF